MSMKGAKKGYEGRKEGKEGPASHKKLRGKRGRGATANDSDRIPGVSRPDKSDFPAFILPSGTVGYEIIS